MLNLPNKGVEYNWRHQSSPLDTIQHATKMKQSEVLKAERSTAKSNFTRKCNLLVKAIEEQKPSKVVEKLWEECSKFYDVVQSKSDEYNNSLILSGVEVEDVYMDEIEARREEIMIKFEDWKMIANVNECKAGIAKFKVEPPKFSGRIRDYLSWTKHYNRLIVPQCGKDPFVLLSCLEGPAKEHIKGLDEYEDITKRLEEVYGDRGQLIDAILDDLDPLKKAGENDKHVLINTINVIERIWSELATMDLGGEIDNHSAINRVQRLLPDSVRLEWLNLIRAGTFSKDFKSLVAFLKERRWSLQCLVNDEKTVKAVTMSVEVEPIPDVKDSKMEDLMGKLTECVSTLSQISVNMATGGATGGAPRSDRRGFTPTGRGGSTGSRCVLHPHGPSVHSTSSCAALQRMGDTERYETLKRLRACFCCLWLHFGSECRWKRPCNIFKSNGVICGKYHHPLLHNYFTILSESQAEALSAASGALVPTVNASTNLTLGGKTLLGLQFIQSKGGSMLGAVYDNGSEGSFITHERAKSLGLKGVYARLNLTKFGNMRWQGDSLLYTLEIVNKVGVTRTIFVAGVDQITSEISPVDLSDVARSFGLDEGLIRRPAGRLDLLIGSDYIVMHPYRVRDEGALRLSQNEFGYCVFGQLKGEGSSSEVLCLRLNHVSLDPGSLQIDTPEGVGEQLRDLFVDETVGEQMIPSCGSCKCGDCTGSNKLNLQEKQEMCLIRNGLEYCKQGKFWTATYPWIKDPYGLPNNYAVAASHLKSLQKRLQRLGGNQWRVYSEQMDDMMKRGVARKLSEEERKEYRGPVHYLPHFGVSSESSSTPLRIVFNASSNVSGTNLNSFWSAGADCLNSLPGILARFREGFCAFIGDVRKMYNSVRISPLDQHCHRFLWSDSLTDDLPEMRVLTRVTFGDKPGGAIAMTAMRETAAMAPADSLGRKIIEEDSYVDDIGSSVDSVQIAQSVTKEIDGILGEGDFHIKKWIISGMDHVQECGQGEEKVLGLRWDALNDEFFFKPKLMFKNCELITSLTELESRIPGTLTKRDILSQVARIYDPIGLLGGFVVLLKLAMRDLVMSKVGWDQAVGQSHYVQWVNLFKELLTVTMLRFPRCIRAMGSCGEPELAIFADGSSKAYGAIAYVRFKIGEDQFVSRLLMSKGKLAPMKVLPIPKVELCGAVLAVRLLRFIVQQMRMKFQGVYFFSDSQIVLSQIRNDRLRHDVFVGNRVAEIQRSSEVAQWHWVPSEQNAADIISRGLNPRELGSPSVWQCGPKFLEGPRGSWPIQENLGEDESVSEAKVNFAEIKSGDASSSCWDELLLRVSCFLMLLRITAKVMKVFWDKSICAISGEPTGEEIRRAEKFWVMRVQESMREGWKQRFARLGPQMEDGVIVVGSRITAWLRENWNRSLFPILSVEHPFTILFVTHIHNLNHGGVESTLAKVLGKYWIPGVRKLIKQVKSRCVLCRKIDKVLLSQQMGPLPIERLRPSPPFFHTAVDLFGPILVKDTVKRRVGMKVFGVIFTCFTTRAIFLDLTEGYDADSFLKTFNRFVSIRGYPRSMYSDRGTQLTASKKHVEGVQGIDYGAAVREGGLHGMSWIFTRSADSPWQNGLTEALIKGVKRAIYASIGESVLTYSDLQTVMYRTANLVNERPIGVKPGLDLEMGGYLCPNDLLLGRSSGAVPEGEFDVSFNATKRLKFIDSMLNCFWKRWQRDYFQTLIVRQKWHTSSRNLAVNDVVLIKDSNSKRGSWRMARVMEANPGDDGKVRNVKVKYKICQPGLSCKGQNFTVIDRSVQNLVLILPIEEQH